MALKINQASSMARAGDARLIRETRDAMVRSVGTMDQIVERGRVTREQGQNLPYAMIGGFLFAFILLMALVGVKNAFSPAAETSHAVAVKSDTSVIAAPTGQR